MLELRWLASHTGAPGDGKYVDAPNRMLGADHTPICEIGKGAHEPADPPVALVEHVSDWHNRAGRPARVVVMAHGFDYDPSEGANPDDDPFSRIYAPPGETVRPGESWLPIVGETDADGNAIADCSVAFGWMSGAGLAAWASAGWSNFYQYAAIDLVREASLALAFTIRVLADAGVGVDIFAHSLGTRASVQALGRLGRPGYAGAVRRAVLLASSEYTIEARDAVAGLTTDVYNFAARGDVVLSMGAEDMLHPFRPINTIQSRVLGRGGLRPTADWLDLQLDRPANRDGPAFDAWFRNLDRRYRLSAAPTRGRKTHWAHYLHAGNRALFTDIFADAEKSITWFRQRGVPEGTTHPLYGEPLIGQPPRIPDTFEARRAMDDRPSHG